MGGAHINNEIALFEVVEAARVFAAFIDSHGAASLPDDMPLTMGSNMARRQLYVGDFRKLRTALTNLDRLNP